MPGSRPYKTQVEKAKGIFQVMMIFEHGKDVKVVQFCVFDASAGAEMGL